MHPLAGCRLLKYITFLPVRPDATPEESEATPVTPVTGRHFQAVARALQENVVFDGSPVTVVPYMLTGATDSRHYLKMSEGGALRFRPVSAIAGLVMLDDATPCPCPACHLCAAVRVQTSSNRTAGDEPRVHGLNERLAIKDIPKAICTYRRALQLLAGV